LVVEATDTLPQVTCHGKYFNEDVSADTCAGPSTAVHRKLFPEAADRPTERDPAIVLGELRHLHDGLDRRRRPHCPSPPQPLDGIRVVDSWYDTDGAGLTDTEGTRDR
jgi:hypothetical protein